MLTQRSGLSAADLASIRDLEARSVSLDGGRLKLEYGVLERRPAEEVNDLFFERDGVLVGFCGLYAFGGPQAEITGMVDPAFRAQGIGTALVVEMLNLCRARSIEEVLLVTPAGHPGALGIVEHFTGTFDHAEHALELHQVHGDAQEPENLTLRRATSDDRAIVERLLADGFGALSHPVSFDHDEEPTMLCFLKEVPIATVRLHHEGATLGIYGFTVDPAHQGHGIGRAILHRLCSEALAHGVSTVHLEVSVDNDRALGLYTSLGFELVTTEHYWNLPLG